MPYSREQWVLGALQELSVVGAGQTPSAEDAKTVDDRIQSVISDLSIRAVWSIGNPDSIDDQAYNHLCIILAQAVASQFGIAPDEMARVMAEGRLKELRRPVDAGDPIRALYF